MHVQIDGATAACAAARTLHMQLEARSHHTAVRGKPQRQGPSVGDHIQGACALKRAIQSACCPHSVIDVEFVVIGFCVKIAENPRHTPGRGRLQDKSARTVVGIVICATRIINGARTYRNGLRAG